MTCEISNIKSNFKSSLQYMFNTLKLVDHKIHIISQENAINKLYVLIAYEISNFKSNLKSSRYMLHSFKLVNYKICTISQQNVICF